MTVLRAGLALACLMSSVAAAAELPAPVRAMIDAAIEKGDPETGEQ
ncbi:hypothetical protein [Altererythrobacter litoralis]|uniref:Uncharacterized protein n=1 Tax=Altererythrobacter litoralis TaxID=3113904 RepID=A0ABU7GCP1_9SPHN|nr:hypothetical protein [Erythrobacteraceae bacterium 1XM1-14]